MVKRPLESILSHLRISSVMLLAVCFVCLVALMAGTTVAASGRSVRVGVSDFNSVGAADHGVADKKPEDGLFLSLAKHVAEKENWSLELVPVSAGQELDLLREGQVDLLMAIPYSREPGQDYVFTREAVISTWAQMYTSEHSAVQSWFDLSSKAVGVLHGDLYNGETRSMARSLGIQCEIVELKHHDEMFRALETGWIDAAVVDRLSGALLEASYKIKRTSVVFAPVELRFAGAKDRSPDLIAALDYHLGMLKRDSGSLYYGLLEKALGRPAASAVPRSLVLGLVAAVTASALLGFTSFLLRRKIRKRTAQLYRNNDELRKEIRLRREAEEALRESRGRYRAIVEDQTELISRFLPDGTITFVNEAFCRYFGRSANNLEGRNLGAVIGEVQLEKKKRLMIGLSLDTPVIVVDLQLDRPYGESRWLRCTDRAIFDGQGILVEFQSVSIDITDRKRAEDAVAGSEKKFRALFELYPEAVFLRDPDGKIADCNMAAEKIMGYSREELQALSVWDLEADNGFLKDHGSGAPPVRSQAETCFLNKKRESFPVEVTSRLLELEEMSLGLVVARDLTERKRIEEELLKVQKLESLGILAGGIAHDFNNILSAIMGNISLALLRCGADESFSGNLEAAEKATIRAKDLTRQLLTFSKGGAPVKHSTTISDLMAESLAFALTGSNVKGELSVEGSLWPVEIDAGQIGQVIHNIILNAQQAMPEGGVVRLTARNCLLGATDDPVLPPGKYVRVAVKDQGGGIPREHLPKIFDPYFTTKSEGTGLGLATSYSIIRKHGGKIDVESVHGSGTVLHVYLPASEKEARTPEKAIEAPKHGHGKVLVMDDDLMVRDMAADMLEYLGYRVALAKDGKETIQKYGDAKKTGQPFDAVIMDLTIPGGLGGKDALKRLMEIDPAVTAIASSGYSHGAVMANFREYGFKGVVVKPYGIRELSAVLEKAIPNGHSKAA